MAGVRAEREEVLDHVNVAEPCCEVERRGAAEIDCGDVGAMFDQEVDDGGRGSEVQRRRANGSGRLDRCARVQEDGAGLVIAEDCRVDQGRL